jgi:hypothetical protein
MVCRAKLSTIPAARSAFTLLELAHAKAADLMRSEDGMLLAKRFWTFDRYGNDQARAD